MGAHFARLYEHVKRVGPRAVFMPEVKVDLTKGREVTQVPAPSARRIIKPVDLVVEEGYSFGQATSEAQVKPERLFYARYARLVTPPPSEGAAYALIDLGNGIFAKCVDYAGKAGDWAIYEVETAATATDRPLVSWVDE